MSRPETSTLMVLCTCPSAEEAERIARALLDARLAACVTSLAGARSWYRWQEAVECSREWLLLIKTTRDHYHALEQTLASLHPYDVPEILSFDASGGLPAYLAWVGQETHPRVSGSPPA